MSTGTCLERVKEKVMDYVDCPLPWHRDQAHLADWQASSTREIVFNLDYIVEARNVAQKQAAKHKRQLTKDDDDDEATMSKPRIVIEGLGGAPADIDEEAHTEDAA